MKLAVSSDGQVNDQRAVKVMPVSIGADFDSECPRYSLMPRKLQKEVWVVNDNLFCIPYDYGYLPEANDFALISRLSLIEKLQI